MLEIVFEDESYIAINKPNGLLVHRSSIASDVSIFAVQELRNQINQHVYPAHRLDRKTSGVLLFAKNKAALSEIRKLFESKNIDKEYIAIVRGYTEDDGTIDYDLKNEKGISKEAVTQYETIERSEIAVPLGKFVTSRYSLIKLTPQTGRMHQLRMHMAHILHPIIGDRSHGCNKQNRHFKSTWNSETMFLHARKLHFVHPLTKQSITIQANFPNEFLRISGILKFSSSFIYPKTPRPMIKCIAIDDDPIFLRLLENYFEEFDNCELIETFKNPIDGVMAVVKAKPHVLLIDLEMPYLDGFETLSTLENKPKIIVISAHLNRPNLPSNLGVDKYISKSALKDPKVLESALVELMS